jgi:hypothetical protein
LPSQPYRAAGSSSSTTSPAAIAANAARFRRATTHGEDRRVRLDDDREREQETRGGVAAAPHPDDREHHEHGEQQVHLAEDQLVRVELRHREEREHDNLSEVAERDTLDEQCESNGRDRPQPDCRMKAE